MGKGFRHDPLADIELIRQNLKDRYGEGFPVLKELLQNADDAGATSVEFVWTPGIKARHQLLQGPGLIAVNDGRFTDADREAIQQMGLSNKLRERESIGKFGLGLKSIFHWCEAFFYLAWSPDANDVEGDILNPWSGESGARSYHGEWDEFSSEEQTAITAYLKPVLPQSKWFCLWIPLRQKTHCDGLTPIQNDFLGDVPEVPGFVTARDLSRRLVETLPLLADLEAIRVWQLSKEGHLEPVTSIELLAGAQRRRYRRDSSCEVGTWPLKGEIRSSTGSIHPFCGQEAVVAEAALKSLKDSALWPSSTRLDGETARAIKVPDKADPHGAAVFLSHSTTGHGRLAVVWSAFLPLGEPVVRVACHRSWEYTLLLHGDFFVDPGRNRPDFGPDSGTHGAQEAPENEADLRRQWNRRLAQLAVVPQVLPALQRFSSAVLDPEATRHLTDAVDQAFTSPQVLGPWRSALTREHQWAFCLDGDEWSWQLLPAGEPLVGIPAPEESESHCSGVVFPALATVSRRLHITIDSWPRIARVHTLADWPEDALLKMLDVDVPGVFGSQVLLDYLVRFLSIAGVHPWTASVQKKPTPGVQEKLISLGRTALLEVDFDILREHGDTLVKFMQCVSPALLFPLDPGQSRGADSIFRSLLRLPLKMLPVPKAFYPAGAPGELVSLSADDAAAMLRALARACPELGEQERAGIVSSLATQILQRYGENRREVLERCCDAVLFEAYDCRQGRRALVTWAQIKDANAVPRLFTCDSPSSPDALAEALQEALDRTTVLLIDRHLASVLLGAEGLRPCTPAMAARAVLAAPGLAPAESRARLLRALLTAAATDPARPLVPAVRYLLHGDHQHIHDLEPLLVEGEGPGIDGWAKLTRQALDLLRAQWRLVPRGLSSQVPPAQRQSVDLQHIEAESVADLLRKAGPEKIRCEELTLAERDQVIRDIDDVDLLRRLVIHMDRTERLRAIDSRTYLDSDFRVDEAFKDLVTILRRSQSRAVLDKQQRLADSWTARTAIRVALDQPRPGRFAGQILDALRSLGGTGDLGGDLKTKLKGTRWLPGRSGDAIAPKHVLRIQEMDDEIAPLTAASEGVFADLGTIDEPTTSHSAFHSVAEDLMPGKEAVLGALGDLVRDRPALEDYRIGLIDLGVVDPEVFFDAFQGVPPGLLRGLPLMQKAMQLVGAAACVKHLIPGLRQNIPADRLAGILDFLVDRHQGLPPAQESVCLRIHRLYLQAVVAGQVGEVICRLRLLNTRGKWREIRELCPPTTTGVDGAHVVDKDQFDILRPVLPICAPPETGTGEPPDGDPEQDRGPDRSAETLRSYFRPWEDHCPRPVIAGFLSLLGDGPIRDLAESFFDNRGRVDTFRSRLEWKPVHGTIPGSWGASDSPLEVMEGQRFRVSVYDPDRAGSVRVRNLLGQVISVPPSKDFEDLLVGERLPHCPVNNPLKQLRTIPISLRAISPERYDERRLSAMLRETARKVLYWVYHQGAPDLDDVWEGLHEAEQKDIRIAQNRLAESLFLYVRQLGLHGHPAIASLLYRWDQAQRLRAEAEDIAGRDGKRLRDEADNDARTAREELKQLLGEDAQVQQLFLGAVQERIERHYQYRPDSIPFELFQNADDAVVELEDMLRTEPLPPSKRQFHLLWDADGLSILHWGRPINTFRRGDFDGRPRGFDADLEKMLVLAASDKGVTSGSTRVTGRFGLGFKSVFLFADRAELVSGRLTCEVVGGLFPRRMDNERRNSLRHRFDHLGLGQREGTLVHLPTAGRGSGDEVAARFRRLAHILLVFSRAIKTCGLHDGDGGSSSTTWHEQAVPGADGIALGQLTPADGSPEEASRAIVFKMASGALLLRLGARGFRPFNSDIPTVWVTAPTDATEGLGFALNAPFDLDVGRAQLASRSDHNRYLADCLGSDLGSALRSLARLASDWPILVRQLGLSPDVTPYEMWDSLWSLFATSLQSRGEETEAVRVVKRVLWGQSEGGVVALISHHDTIPSGLRGRRYQMLTRRERVSLRTEGCLDERGEVLERVSEWATFQEKVRPGSVVSGKIAATLSDLLPSPVVLQPVTLSSALTWEVGGAGHVAPSTAARLGEVVTRELLDELRAGNQSAQAEHEELRKLLRGFRFMARDGMYHEPGELVVDSERMDEDESLRARFAPASRVLAQQYAEDGLSFFLLCRGREQPSIQGLARWMLDAIGQETRVAALRYLALGQLNREIAGHLRGKIAGTWLGDLRSSPLMTDLDQWERNMVLLLLDQLPPLPPPPPPPPHLPPVKQLLERVSAWWEEEGRSYTEDYDAQVYPAGAAPRLSTNWDGCRSDLRPRKEWLRLFLLGACFTLGRVRREQNRGFVELCDTLGWLDTFARPKRERDGDAIIGALRAYLEQGIDHLEFHYWMRLFLPLFQLSSWLDEYVWVFLQLERQRAPVDLRVVLSPNANPKLSGTGISAPPLGGTLGIGVCFVLRELARHHVLTKEAVHGHCYVPSRPVRRFLRRLDSLAVDDNGPRVDMSQQIHQFLVRHLGAERARFGECFDIPLLLLAEDPGLQERVLGETVWIPDGEDSDEELLP